MTQLRINTVDLNLPAEVLKKVELSFTEALERFEATIRQGEITLRDLNGPKGGIDKQCKVQLKLYPRGLVVVRSVATSYTEAVNDACDRMRQVVVKRLSKRKQGPKMKLSNLSGREQTYGN